jgi:hypothetical protein
LSILGLVLALSLTASAGNKESSPEGMVWILGGEFDMGAIVNGAQLRDGDAFE